MTSGKAGKRSRATVFKSFFPNPKYFFSSALLWTLIAVLAWYFGGKNLGALIGLAPPPDGTPDIIGLGYFVTKPFLWFYIYFAIWAGSFGLFWQIYARDLEWRAWSIWGSIFILFSTYYSVQVDVALNVWRGPFFDMIQLAFTGPNKVAVGDIYVGLFQFAEIAFVATIIFVITRFFISHYVFRWRTAMNNYYVSHWPRLRKIEGASQRIQEDTMRFADITEGLGVSFIEAIMTLIAFLPLLYMLSSHVTELPLVGAIPAPLVFAALCWSIFGTTLLAIVGIKLPGLSFLNQRVEAAYRKELVYGEDHEDRADPPTLAQLFANVRRNYFRLYFHYVYFNVARSIYSQADNIFAYVILAPTLAAGKLTLGVFQQILTAFGQVSNSFQYLVNAWPTIIELLSIHKRLRAFEAALNDEPLPTLDQEYFEETDGQRS